LDIPDRADSSVLSVLVIATTQHDVEKIQGGLPETSTIRLVQDFTFLEISADIMKLAPDLLILSSESADPGQVATTERLAASEQVPIVWFVKCDDNGLAPSAIRAGVTSFVVDGLTPTRIAPLITIAMERYKLVAALQGELQKSKDSLAARKIVERAKGLLMQTRGMSEQEAYKTLRSMAMRQGKPLKSVCDAVISMSDLLP
jgi:two-component system, response regulator / RNA-binding antiterminator